MFGRRLIVGVFCVAGLGTAPAATCAESGGPILLADDTKLPHVRVRWVRADGTETLLEADLPYTSPDGRVRLGENLEAFVALGGSRLEKGAGYPGGAIVRVGLYKADRDLLMFEDIANGGELVIELTNVVFNQPAVPDPETLVQRLEYKADDILACGLTINQTEMFNVHSDDDNMGGTILPEQARFSCLGGADENGGEAAVTLEGDGSIALRAVVPYRLLRHKGDPWALEVPGTFFEPFHFDLEYEVLPWDMAEAEGLTLELDRLPAEPGRTKSGRAVGRADGR